MILNSLVPLNNILLLNIYIYISLKDKFEVNYRLLASNPNDLKQKYNKYTHSVIRNIWQIKEC